MAQDLSQTEAFLQSAGIPFASPSAPEFEALNHTWLQRNAKPAGIAQPATAEDVAAIVKHCVAEKVPFAIRGGGHDVTGLSPVQDVLAISLRKLKTVNVSADKKSAQIGGGIQTGEILEALASQGLEVPTGIVSTVGYVGWATVGGYGPTSSSLGLGCDQILGAKVVNAKGGIVDADEKMLKGIRGGGGNFGVIVELTVKVHPLAEAQCATVLYESSDPTKSFASLLANYQALLDKEELPPNLHLTPGLLAIPNMGPTVFTHFIWRGTRDHDGFRTWLAHAARLGQPLFDLDTAVTTQSMAQFTKSVGAMLPPQVYGQVHGCSGTSFAPDVIAVLSGAAAAIPRAGGAAVSTHVLRECSPSVREREDSVFPARRAHYLFEVLGVSAVGEEQGSEAAAWAKGVRDGLAGTEVAMAVNYASLTSREYADVDRMFGGKAAELKELKREFDPENVFRYAVPKMG